MTQCMPAVDVPRPRDISRPHNISIPLNLLASLLRSSYKGRITAPMSCTCFCPPMVLDLPTCLLLQADPSFRLLSTIHQSDPVPRLSLATAGALVRSMLGLPAKATSAPGLTAPGKLLYLAGGGSSLSVLPPSSRPARIVLGPKVLADHPLSAVIVDLLAFAKGRPGGNAGKGAVDAGVDGPGVEAAPTSAAAAAAPGPLLQLQQQQQPDDPTRL